MILLDHLILAVNDGSVGTSSCADADAMAVRVIEGTSVVMIANVTEAVGKTDTYRSISCHD